MDVIHQHERKLTRGNLVKWVLVGSVLAIALLFSLLSNRSITIPFQQVNIKQVQYGNVPLTINTYGKLISQDTRFLSAKSAGTVEKIWLKPGAKVQKGTVILELSNPSLQQQVESATLKVHQAEINLKKITLELKNNMLEYQSNIELLKSELESAQLTYEAERKLEQSGVVSKLQIQTSKINVTQLQVRLKIANKRLAHLKTINKTRISVEQELVNLEKSQLNLQQKNQQALIVRAGIDGVLQRLPVELGANVTRGEPLAVIGSVDRLDAELRVPQSQADDIQLGSHVLLNVSQHSIAASVSRIDPVVTNGYVTIEAKITEPLPVSARPDINVQGVINAGAIENTLFLETPANIAGNSNANLFVLNENDEYATLYPIQFGKITGRYIQITGGVTKGQKVVVSDIDKWRSFDQILLTGTK
jgi:multidrug efflux pump subunit AcrA (membrane-fusion protein)